MSCQKYVDANPHSRVSAMIEFIQQHRSQIEAFEAGSVEFNFNGLSLKSSVRIFEMRNVRPESVKAAGD